MKTKLISLYLINSLLTVWFLVGEPATGLENTIAIGVDNRVGPMGKGLERFAVANISIKLPDGEPRELTTTQAKLSQGRAVLTISNADIHGRGVVDLALPVRRILGDNPDKVSVFLRYTIFDAKTFVTQNGGTCSLELKPSGNEMNMPLGDWIQKKFKPFMSQQAATSHECVN